MVNGLTCHIGQVQLNQAYQFGWDAELFYRGYDIIGYLVVDENMVERHTSTVFHHSLHKKNI